MCVSLCAQQHAYSSIFPCQNSHCPCTLSFVHFEAKRLVVVVLLLLLLLVTKPNNKTDRIQSPFGGEGGLIKMFCKRISPKPTHTYIYICMYICTIYRYCMYLAVCMHAYVCTCACICVCVSSFFAVLFFIVLFHSPIPLPRRLSHFSTASLFTDCTLHISDNCTRTQIHLHIYIQTPPHTPCNLLTSQSCIDTHTHTRDDKPAVMYAHMDMCIFMHDCVLLLFLL